MTNILTCSPLYFQDNDELIRKLFDPHEMKEALETLCLKINEEKIRAKICFDSCTMYSKRFHYENDGKDIIMKTMEIVVEENNKLNKFFNDIEETLKEKDSYGFLTLFDKIQAVILKMRDHMKDMLKLLSNNGYDNSCGCGCVDCYRAEQPEEHCGCVKCEDYSDSDEE